jgi:hypothetical protein
MSFFSTETENRKAKQVCLGSGYQGREENKRKGVGESIWLKYMLMYGNGKMRPVETIPGIEGGG